ncbi:hypothetical protein ACFXKG_40335 [Streptomyces sp. NPDC059255]|uniref:hypothetical protein n=1 Tax=Streptomyces sp. NPDC059255 TaxID=3346793 RepID=UPI0036C46074
MTLTRRPLGTGPDRAALSRTRDTDPPSAPRGRLAAERIEDAVPVPAAAGVPAAPPDRRRALGTGPAGL